MSVYKLRCFGNPEVLRKLSLENLMLLLGRFSEYFQRVNFPLPENPSEETFDYASLAEFLLNPMFDLTTGLFDALVLIDGMAREEFFDILLEHLSGKPYAAPNLEKMPVGDLALQIYLNDPDLLKRLGDRLNMKDPQSFCTFVGKKRVSGWAPSMEQTQELQRLFNLSFIRHGRGDTVRVTKFQTDDEFCFLVRKGEALTCRGAIFPEYEETRNLICRLESFDVVFLNPTSGRLRMTIGGARTTWMRAEYPQIFGKAFFSDGEFFQARPLHDFSILRSQDGGALCCRNIDEILDVKLTECEVVKAGAGNSKHIYKSDDVFLDWANNGVELKKSDIIRKVKFTVIFRDKKKKTFTLYDDNRSGYRYDYHAMLFEDWLIDRKIFAEQTEEREYERQEQTLAKHPVGLSQRPAVGLAAQAGGFL